MPNGRYEEEIAKAKVSIQSVEDNADMVSYTAPNYSLISILMGNCFKKFMYFGEINSVTLKGG